MPLEDKALRLRCMREVARRPVDYSQLRISVMNNVCYMAGVIRPARAGGLADMKKEMEIIRESMEHVPGVREVVTRELKVFPK